MIERGLGLREKESEEIGEAIELQSRLRLEEEMSASWLEDIIMTELCIDISLS